jgi:hypothetical protein
MSKEGITDSLLSATFVVHFGTITMFLLLLSIFALIVSIVSLIYAERVYSKVKRLEEKYKHT